MIAAIGIIACTSSTRPAASTVENRDLAWHYYCDSLRGPDVERRLLPKADPYLRSSKVYLRIGLARGWKEFPDRCYLQITGIYTFPDYWTADVPGSNGRM